MSDSSKPSEVANQVANLADTLSTIIKSIGILPLSALATTVTLTSFPIFKIGPGRALSIFFRSKFFGRPQVASQRTREVALLRDAILVDEKLKKGYFLVVQGAKGIGKSTAIETALKHTPGVIYVPAISSDKSLDEIEESVFTEITNIRYKPMPKRGATKRVLLFYKILCWFGRRQPIVVIPATGRNVDQPMGYLAQAARHLSDQGIKVVVDCSDGVVDHKEGVREERYHMEPMPDDLFQKLFPSALGEFLKKFGTYDVVFELCRGVPACLNSLERKWDHFFDDNSRLKAVDSYVCQELDDAIWFRDQIATKPNMNEILDGCLGVPDITILSNPITKRLSHVDFHKVFRVTKKEVNGIKMSVIVPSSPVMAMVLRAGLTGASLKLAQELVVSWKKMDEMLDFLRKNDHYKLVAEICRGKQDAWSRLEKRWREAKGDEAKKAAVRMFVREELVTAIQEKNRVLSDFPQIKDCIELFKVNINRLEKYQQLNVSPTDIQSVLVVRVVDCEKVYVPRSPTMAIVLAAGLRDEAQLSFDFDESKPENSLSFEDVKQILDSWTERDISIVY